MSRQEEVRSGGAAPPRTRARDAMLALLAMAAGCVDAASFLGLGQVMTAAMTGNTVLLGLALGQADVQGTLRATVALAAFAAGALVGAAIVGRGPRGVMWTPAIAAALALELVILVVLALAWQVLEGGPGWAIDYRHLLIAAAGLAMGIQSAAAQRVGVPGVTTTYITGTLTSIAARLVDWRRSSAAMEGDRAAAPRAPWLQASVWIAYGAGAVFAGLAHLWWPSLAPVLGVLSTVRWASAALLLPIGIIVLVILISATVHRRPASA